MLSFGDYSQWESDVTKIVRIPKTAEMDTYALMAGGLGECEAVLNEIYGIGNLDDSVLGLTSYLERIFQEKFSHFQEIEVLHKRGISKEAYERAIASPSVSPPMQEIYDNMKRFYFDCDVILCGINNSYRPYIISAAPPGKAFDLTRQGYSSIGIGADIANSRLLWSGYKRVHSIGRVLFDVFDAKANAEMSPGVGFSWDGVVIFADDGKAYSVPKRIKELIERSWDQHNRSPFEEWNPDEDLPPPEEGWKDKILALSKSDLELTKDWLFPQSTTDDRPPPPPSLG
jgi:hypothetical protein